MDRGAWRVTVHRVARSQTRLKRFSTHAPLFPKWKDFYYLRQTCILNPSNIMFCSVTLRELYGKTFSVLFIPTNTHKDSKVPLKVAIGKLKPMIINTIWVALYSVLS